MLLTVLAAGAVVTTMDLEPAGTVSGLSPAAFNAPASFFKREEVPDDDDAGSY